MITTLTAHLSLSRRELHARLGFACLTASANGGPGNYAPILGGENALKLGKPLFSKTVAMQYKRSEARAIGRAARDAGFGRCFDAK